MRLYFFFIMLSVSGIPLKGYSQLKIQTGEHFLSGSSFKKIHVCVEDHSVWALSDDGKVYYKKNADLDFSIYAPTVALIVTAFTGFNADEMYFVSSDRVIRIKNNTQTFVDVPFPGVTRINDISVVYGRDNATAYNNGLDYKDYLVIATNKSFYYALRGNTAATLRHNYVNPPNSTEQDGSFGYTGFKGIDLRFMSPSDYCGVYVDRLTENISFGASYVSYIPDKGAYNAVNATISARNFYQPFLSSSSNRLFYNIWGSSNGLFIRNIISCNQSVIKHELDGEYINDIEEIYALTPIYKQDYLIAAAKTGIYYTPESIFNLPLTDPNAGKFIKLTDFPTKNVTSISTETDYLGVFSHGQDRYYSLCERVVWASTESGIYKLYLTLDQDYFNNYKWSDMRFSMPPSNNNFEEPNFQICGTDNVTITTAIPPDFANQILIKWFKDGVEVPSSTGQLQMTFQASGVYCAKITSLCENITVTSNPITIQYNAGPEITFSPPAKITICNNQPYVMETKSLPNYTYQWYKDEVKINGATQFRYQATVSGKYRVDVNNNSCPSIQSSSSVEVKFTNIPIPQLTTDKSTYCVGDLAQLSVANSGYAVKWYMNGVEINGTANQDKITVTQSGVYKAEFITTACSNSSIDYPISFNALPTAIVTRSSHKVLCYGETVTLSANEIAGATYLWNTGEQTRNITVGLPGKYKVIVTNAANCSLESTEVEVQVNEDLRFANPVITSIKKDYCIGETAILSVENVNSLTIKWYLDGVELTNWSNANQITTTLPGNYEVALSNVLNCEKTSPKQAITFNNKLAVTISVSGNRSICAGESVRLSAGLFPNATYLWSNGEKTETITVTKSGNYSVTVSSQFSCSTISDPVEVIINPLPVLTTNEKLTICETLKQEVLLQADPGFVSYTWNKQGGKEQSLTVSKAGIYTVEVEDINGCKASKTFEIVPYCKQILAPNAFSPNGDGVNDFWKVSGLEYEPNASIQIFNRLGVLVFNGRGNNPIWNGNIKNSPAPIGIYYYVITTPKSSETLTGILTIIR